MTEKSEWQEANRERIAEERRRLGGPPTAEEMLAYSRGELSESEEERIRDLIVAYPELARMYAEPFPDEPRPGDADYVAEEQVAVGWGALQRRLRQTPEGAAAQRDEAQRGRMLLRYIPTAVAAVIALVFFGLYVQAERQVRYFAQQAQMPKALGEPQGIEPDGNRGPDSAMTLRRDEGDAYSLAPAVINQPRFPHYHIELRDTQGAVLWTSRNARPDVHDRFLVVIPHPFLAPGEDYRLVVYGVDGEQRTEIGTYDLRAPAE